MAEQAGPHVDQVRQLFDAKAAAWSTKYVSRGRLSGRLIRLADALQSRATPGSYILDLGCGTGELARAAAAAGMRAAACDISAEMLSRAAARDSDGNVEWVRLAPCWSELPFHSANFDLVVASSVFEYVDDPAAVLGECARVLRSGGTLVCTVPNLSHPIRWMEQTAGLAARIPMARTVSCHWPRLDEYLTYLRISRRRPARWWQAVAAEAGLMPVPRPLDPRQHSPLRLMIFERPAGSRGNS